MANVVATTTCRFAGQYGDASNLYNEIIKKADAWREFGWDLDFGTGNFSNPYQRTTVKSRSPSSLLHNEESELSDESE